MFPASPLHPPHVSDTLPPLQPALSVSDPVSDYPVSDPVSDYPVPDPVSEPVPNPGSSGPPRVSYPVSGRVSDPGSSAAASGHPASARAGGGARGKLSLGEANVISNPNPAP